LAGEKGMKITNVILFWLAGLPGLSAMFFAVCTGLMMQVRIDKDKVFRSKYTGWGGDDFWRDAKKIDDPKLQKLIYIYEAWVPTVAGIGFALTAVLGGTLVYFKG
jgi:hypothetical protein